MEYYIEKKKEVFSYTLNGIEHTEVTPEYVSALGGSDEDIKILEHELTRFNNQLNYFERKWRNKILALTDWLMVEDATYKGVEVRDSNMFDEIKAYRKALREYDPIAQDRPVRPSWVQI